MTYDTPALVIFEPEGTHPLSFMLGHWQHVWCIVRDKDGDDWIGFDWLRGRVEMTWQGDDVDTIVEYHSSRGATVVPCSVDLEPVARFSWPLVVHNCVGMTKRVLRSNSWALTPYGLYKSILGDEKLTRRTIASWATLPGGSLFGTKPPKAPPPPPPPPTMQDAASSSLRKRMRMRAASAKGNAGSIANTGGGLGVSTDSATTTSKTLLGG